MEMIRALSLLVALAVPVPGVFAARPRQGATPPNPTKIALRAARLVDGKGGAPVEPAVVLINGKMIVAAGADPTIPPGYEVIDLGDATILPGLIDCHTHLCTHFRGELGGDDPNGALTLATQGTAKRALLGAKNARECLQAGITTVRDLGNCGMNADVALRDAIQQSWVSGPRMVCSTRALAAAGGQFSGIAREAQALIDQEYVVISGVEEARKAVRQAFYDGADCIKVIVNTGARVLTPAEMSTIVEEAHRVNKKVAAHATDPQSTKIAADASVDSIEHGYTIPDEVLKTMAEKHIFLVPTDGTADTYVDIFQRPRNLAPDKLATMKQQIEAMLPRMRDRIRRAAKLGVPIAMGSDMYYAMPGKTRGEASLLTLRAYVDSGLTPMEAIQTATSRAAELLDLGSWLGTVEPVRIADLVAVRGNPTKDIADLDRVFFVMKEGEVVRR